MKQEPPFAVGDRIELVEMPKDPYPIPPNTTGTVLQVQDFSSPTRPLWHVTVKWDTNRSLSLVIPPDRARKLEST